MENVITNKYELHTEYTSETALINGTICGNKQKLIELITLYKSYLYRTAYAYVKDEYKAKEILQECTYKAFSNVKKLKNPDYFKTWITKILINSAIDTIRKDSRTEYIEDNNALISTDKGPSLEEKIDLIYEEINLIEGLFLIGIYCETQPNLKGYTTRYTLKNYLTVRSVTLLSVI